MTSLECLIGIKFNDFVMLAADMSNIHSIMVMKTDENKIHQMSNKLLMAISGDQGDCSQFSEYIAKNIQLYKMRNGYELSPKAAAVFTRRNLAEALRSRTPYRVDMLLAGYDAQSGPQLFYMDYLASMADLKFAAHGYGGLFTVSVMDRYHSDTLNQEEAYELMKKCVAEVNQRLVVNLPKFQVKVVDATGIHELPPIIAKDLVA